MYYANWESDDVIRFANKVIKYKNISISEMKKDIPKMKMPSLVVLKSLSNKWQLFFISWAL